MTTTAERRPEETDRIIKEWTRRADRQKSWATFMTTRESVREILSWIRVTERAVDSAREEIKTKEKEAKEAGETIRSLWTRTSNREAEIRLLTDRLVEQGETIGRYQKKVKELEASDAPKLRQDVKILTDLLKQEREIANEAVRRAQDEVRHLKKIVAETLNDINQDARDIAHDAALIQNEVGALRQAITNGPSDQEGAGD